MKKIFLALLVAFCLQWPAVSAQEVSSDIAWKTIPCPSSLQSLSWSTEGFDLGLKACTFVEIQNTGSTPSVVSFAAEVSHGSAEDEAMFICTETVGQENAVCTPQIISGQAIDIAANFTLLPENIGRISLVSDAQTLAEVRNATWNISGGESVFKASQQSFAETVPVDREELLSFPEEDLAAFWQGAWCASGKQSDLITLGLRYCLQAALDPVSVGQIYTLSGNATSLHPLYLRGNTLMEAIFEYIPVVGGAFERTLQLVPGVERLTLGIPFGAILQDIHLSRSTPIVENPEQQFPIEDMPEDEEVIIGLPDPTYAYCNERGGTMKEVVNASGDTDMYCVSPTGKECLHWAFYEGSCTFGGSGVVHVPTPGPTPIPEEEVYATNPEERAAFEQTGVLEGRHVILRLHRDTAAQLQQPKLFVEKLDRIYEFYETLAGGVPYNGEKIALDERCGRVNPLDASLCPWGYMTHYDATGQRDYWGLAGNPVEIISSGMKSAVQLFNTQKAMPLGLAHEFGHDFDVVSSRPQYKFHTASVEAWANLKAIYAIDAAGVPLELAGTVYTTSQQMIDGFYRPFLQKYQEQNLTFESLISEGPVAGSLTDYYISVLLPLIDVTGRASLFETLQWYTTRQNTLRVIPNATVEDKYQRFGQFLYVWSCKSGVNLPVHLQPYRFSIPVRTQVAINACLEQSPELRRDDAAIEGIDYAVATMFIPGL